MECLSSFSFATLLLASSPPPQEALAEFRGFGSNVADIGDVDADGVADFLAGDRLHGVSGRTLKTLFDCPYSTGRLNQPHELVLGAGDRDGDGYGDLVVLDQVLSGRELLFPTLRGGVAWIGSLTPPPVSVYVLGGVARLGDLDGDGIDELAAGWPDCYVSRCPGDRPTFVSGSTSGFARILSSRDGTALHEFVAGAGDGFGGVVTRLGDIDGDGHSDLGIATRRPPLSPTAFCSLAEGNFTRAVSSLSGALLWEVPTAPRTLASVDDLDADGIEDVAFGFPYLGVVELRSGRTGALLRALLDDYVGLGNGTHLFGHTLAAYPDTDGDRLGDLLVSAPQPLIFPIGVPGDPTAAGPGRVLVVSTRSGKLLAELHGKVRGEEFGMSLALLEDLDGDARPEVAVGSSGVPGGLVQVFSMRRATPHSPRPR